MVKFEYDFRKEQSNKKNSTSRYDRLEKKKRHDNRVHTRAV